MHAWIDFNGFTMERLFTELNIEMIPDSSSFKSQINQSLDIVRALEIKSVVNVFCQNVKKFGADFFRERLTAVSVHEFLTMKMFPISHGAKTLNASKEDRILLLLLVF